MAIHLFLCTSQTIFKIHVGVLTGSLYPRKDRYYLPLEDYSNRDRQIKVSACRGRGANLGELSRIKGIRGAGADEALQCYKSLLDVLDFQGVNETIEICHYLRPIGVAIAGDEAIDPYKD